MLKKKDLQSLIIIIFLYIILLFILKRNIFSYQFNKNLINRYFLSQDISHEVAGKRLFLSDVDIYIASGYLYVKGADPTVYNFDHPPLLKYLFGISIILFNNPIYVQILFGMLIIITLYFFGLKVFNNKKIAILACLLLIFDPLFLNQSSQPLLDLGETLLMLLYGISILYFPNIFLQGVVLGLFAGAKSIITPLFFMLFFWLYKIYKREYNLRLFIYHLVVAFIIYCLLYTKSFIASGGKFNIVFFILKTIKYRIQHNITSFPGASLILFLTGYFKTWWGIMGWVRENVWSILWPIGFIVSLIIVPSIRKINLKKVIAIIPIIYIIFLGVQAPFSRYFMIILPFTYLTLAEFIINRVRSIAWIYKRIKI